MKSGFIFTVIFTLFFTLFLLLSIIYLRNVQMSELNLVEIRNISKISYTQDDISRDILDYLKVSISIDKNSTHTSINLTDALPSTYTTPIAELNSYKSFINGTYANQTNLIDSNTNASLISLNTSRFESSPSIYFISSNSSLDMRYAYNNLSKNELIINGTTYIRNYSIAMQLSETCLNNNCANATWAGGPPNNDSSTRGFWHFDEGNGTTTADSSGNGNTGNLVGSPQWVGGRFGNALTFNGVNQYANASNSSTLSLTGSLTVEAWIYDYNSTSYGMYVGKLDSSVVSGYYLYTDSRSAPNCNTCLKFVYYNGHTRYEVGAQYTSNTWLHIVGVVEQSGSSFIQKIYVNGVLQNSSTNSVSAGANVSPLIIGSWNGNSLFINGMIDEVAIYSRAKSAEEIYADANLFHWDWGPIAINNNISAAWHFDEGSGTTTADSSGNGNIGTFTGTSITTLIPSSSNKAYKVSLTSGTTPASATTEFSSADYGNITTSDNQYVNTTYGISGGTCDTGYTTASCNGLSRTECQAQACCEWDSEDHVCLNPSCSTFTSQSACQSCGCTWTPTWYYYNHQRYTFNLTALGLLNITQITNRNASGTVGMDSNYDWTNPNNAFILDGSYTECAEPYDPCNQDYYGFNFNLPANISIGTVTITVVQSTQTSSDILTVYYNFDNSTSFTYGQACAFGITNCVITIPQWMNYTMLNNLRIRLHGSTTYFYVRVDWIGVNVTYYTFGPNSITNITRGWEGFKSGTGTATISDYNQTCNWCDGGTVTTEQTYTRTFTITELGTLFQNGMFTFGLTGNSANISADFAYLNVTFSALTGPFHVASIFNNGLSFTGDVMYSEVSSSSSLNITNQLTLEAWIKPNTIAPAYQTILEKGNSSAENYGLYLKGDELYFEWANSGLKSIETTTANLEPNTWHHVAAVFNYSGSSVKLYVDGIEKATSSPTADLLANNATLRIGVNMSTTYYFNGIIDEVAIYSRAKSADEIYADANPTYAILNINDSLSNPVTIRGGTSGYVNPSANNTFSLKLNNNGILNMTAGAYSGFYSLRAYFSNVTATSTIATILDWSSEIKAVLPVDLVIANQNFTNLIIKEK